MDQGIFHTIHVVFQAYHSFVNMIFEGILDFLHTFISFIPSYQQYSQSNTMLSIDGVLLLNLFIFQTIITVSYTHLDVYKRQPIVCMGILVTQKIMNYLLK